MSRSDKAVLRENRRAEVLGRLRSQSRGQPAEMGESIPFASRPMPYSDHFNFMVQGVPCCNLGSIGGAPHGRGYGHTAADTFDKVSRADLREAASVLTRCLIRFANDRRWALPHKSKADVCRILDRYELISVMKTEGTLPEALQ